MKILSLIFIPFTLLLFSCSCPCIKAELYFSLVGFTDSEADTIILRKYSRNTKFTSSIDTFFFHNNDIRFERTGDTLRSVAYLGHAVLDIDFDYEMFFPESQFLYRISEITETKLEQHCTIIGGPKVACENEVSSCKVNGTITGHLISTPFI